MRLRVRVSECRGEKTFDQIAGALGVSVGSIENWNAGRHFPTLQKFVSLSRLLGCKLNDLLESEW